MRDIDRFTRSIENMQKILEFMKQSHIPSIRGCSIGKFMFDFSILNRYNLKAKLTDQIGVIYVCKNKYVDKNNNLGLTTYYIEFNANGDLADITIFHSINMEKLTPQKNFDHIVSLFGKPHIYLDDKKKDEIILANM